MTFQQPAVTKADTRLCYTPYLLRFLRISKQWSLFDACVAWKAKYPEPNLKIAKNQVLEYEVGDKVPRADRLAMLCELYEVDPDFLFTRSRKEMLDKMGDMAPQIMRSIQTRGSTAQQRNKPRKPRAVPADPVVAAVEVVADEPADDEDE